ncbi:hypothetical protein CN428_24595 [Bacillus cereus]|nr:hypothetical protein CN428_24595 [Bacillus cereus]
MDITTTTAITILGSFGAASTAQIISHGLTLRREQKNFKKECYQNLYAPTIFKLTNYIETEGVHYARHKSDGASKETSNLFKEIMTDIASNLKYANLELINLYMIWQNRNSKIENNTLTYISFEHELHLRFQLAEVFFSHFTKINQSLNNTNKLINKEMQVSYFFVHFYFVMKEYCSKFLLSSSDIIGLYDLISRVLELDNNYKERIIIIRKKMQNVNSKSKFSPQYKSSKRALIIRFYAYTLLSEIVQSFKDFDEARANHLQEILDMRR